MNRTGLLFLMAGLFLVSDLDARQAELRFHHLTIDDGLSQSTIHAMLQDRDGFLWLGTSDGLNRYDGYDITVYRSEPGDTTSLSHEDIRVLYEDRDGVLWVGTQAGGLNRYDPDRDRFRAYVGDADDYQTLSSNSVWALLEDRQGRFWVGTAYGLNRMDRESGQFYRYHAEAEDSESSLASNQVIDLFECSSGTIWVGTSSGLNRMDPETETFHLPAEEEPGTLENAFVRTIYEDRNGVIWVGTEEDGLFYRQPEDEVFRNIRADGDSRGLNDNTIYDIREDAAGRLWVGTGNRGLALYDRENERFHHYEESREDPYSIGSNGVNSLYLSRDGIFWAGTTNGANRLDSRADRFGVYRSSPVNPWSLSNNSVQAFLQDERGRIWIGTDGGGLNIYDPETGRFTHHVYDPENRIQLSSDTVLDLYESDEGIWVGTYGAGVELLDPEELSVNRHLRNEPRLESSLSSDYAFVVSGSRSGEIWFGLNRGGVNRLNSAEETLTRYRADPDRPHDPELLNNDDVRAIHEDSRGDIWIGNFGERNLVRLNPETERFEFFDLNVGEPFYSSAVAMIHEDDEGWLWLATRGGGLKRFDPESGEFRSYTTREGLPSNLVQAVVEDENGELWVSSNQGLTRFKPETGEIRNFSPADGLQSREFSPAAAYRDREGYLYFGGVNGFNRFHPDSIRTDSLVPPVVLTGFEIFNRPVPVGEDSPLQRQITRAGEVVLSHDQSVISFEYAALDFGAVKNNRFAYMMEGFEEEWNHVGDFRRATYTNLDPGTYTFRVRAANSDGIWGDEEVALSVVIAPPFWQTGWFRLLFGIGLLGIIGLVFQLRTYSIRRQNRRLAKIVHERTRELETANETKDRLFSIIAHDMNNVVGGLAGLSELLVESLRSGRNEEAEEYAGHLQESSGQLSRMLRNLLDWARSQTGRIKFNPSLFPMSEQVNEVLRQEKGKAANKKIDLSSEVDPEINVYADPDMVSVVLRNLVHNALKFTPRGGSVKVTAEPKVDDVEIAIHDTGVGMDRETLEKLLDKSQQVTTKGTDQERGTGLGFTLCRDFIQRNGGRLTVESEKGEGSVFRFTLPADVPEEQHQEPADFQAERVS